MVTCLTIVNPFQVKAIEELKLQLREAAARETSSGNFQPRLVHENLQFRAYPEPACQFGSDSSYMQTVAEPLTHSPPSASIHVEGGSICEATADVDEPSLPDGVLGSWSFGRYHPRSLSCFCLITWKLSLVSSPSPPTPSLSSTYWQNWPRR
jgi:hypothetical protein